MSICNIQNGRTVLSYDEAPGRFSMKTITAGTPDLRAEAAFACPNFQLMVEGEDYGDSTGVMAGASFLPHQCRFTGLSKEGNMTKLTYLHERLGLEVTVALTAVPGTDGFRQVNSVRNVGETSRVLTNFSSLHLQGLAAGGILPWHDARKIRIHYAHSTWNGEGQWRTVTPEEVGIYPSSTHGIHNTFQLSSVGSWTTARFSPLLMIEDCETGEITYAQIESPAAWMTEIGVYKAGEGVCGALYLNAGACDETVLGWRHELKPGETFQAPGVFFGCTAGGFEAAVRALTKYRRTRKPAAPYAGAMPLMFNDYMNCLWGLPTTEDLLPLIDRAAAVGCEGFCIDAGWFSTRAGAWDCGIGDYEPSPDRFGEGGLGMILDTIRKKGMRPGVWLEMEAVSSPSKLWQTLPETCFICRGGKRVGRQRAFLDYREKEVTDYMESVIDRLYAMGVRYIKNDDNQTTGQGDDKRSGPPDGIREATAAFYAFIDGIRAKYPDLMIENCGSGGMRHDGEALSHFHWQSCSDQELCTRYPGIVSGMLAEVLPEQAGLWSTPFPHTFEAMMNHRRDFVTPAFAAARADGEETVFTMTVGLCGSMLLSGRIDGCDETNLALVKEGCALWRAEREFLHSSYPVWPCGLFRINARGYAVQGFVNEEGTRMLLALFRCDEPEDTVLIPLSAYFPRGTELTVTQRYPVGKPAQTAYHAHSGILSVRTEKQTCARYFEIRIKDEKK